MLRLRVDARYARLVTAFLAAALSFPGVVYTVVLAVALVYWLRTEILGSYTWREIPIT